MKWLLPIIGNVAASLVRSRNDETSALPAVTTPGRTEGFDPASRLTFEETAAQMQRGYENTQRAVQFMDAKAGAVIAFSLAIFAFVGKLIAWIYGVVGAGLLAGWEAPHCCILGTLVVLLFGEVVLGGLCLYRAFMTIRPNGLPQPEHFTTLFPAMENAWDQPKAVEYLNRVVAGENRDFMLGEFKQQLLAMGGIVYLKIKRLQQSITALCWQGLFAILIGLLIGGSAGLGWLPQAQSVAPPPVPAAVPQAK
jgi:hypothetical protein